MNALQHSFKTKLRINGLFLMACLCGIISWVSWPTSVEWWGFGFVSIVMGLTTVILTVKAIGEIIAVYSRDKTIAVLMAQGVDVKADDLADPVDLKSKGMVDG